MARYTVNVEITTHGLVMPVSVGTWLAPDEPDLWVRSLAAAGYPVQMSSVVVHMTPEEFLNYYRRGQ